MGYGFYDKDGTPLGLLEWTRKHEQFDYRQVAFTTVEEDTEISTVWLGADHQFAPNGPPLIFETMVFSSDPLIRDALDGETERYTTLHEAKQGHEAMVLRVRQAILDAKERMAQA
jgi:hypothetical protein